MFEKQEINSSYAFIHRHLALFFLQQGRLFDAETTIMKGIDTLKHLEGTYEELPSFYYVLATIYNWQGRLAEAEETYILAIEGMKLLPDENNARLVEANLRLYLIYCPKKRYSEAKRVLKFAIDLIEKTGDFHKQLVEAYKQLAGIYFLQMKWLRSEVVHVK